MSPPPAQPAAQLRLVDICKRLGNLNAVDHVSLDVARGTIVTLLGPSGCGKSTTLRLLAGLYRPDAGRILLDGQDVTDLPPNRRRMTMVFQEYALFPHLSVAGNVGYGLRIGRVAPAKAEARVGEMLELVGLSGQTHKYPHQLSGGQQQRVALARALAVDPEVLLLDEPLSNLDAKLRVRLREEIVRLQKVVGKTMVFVTHDQEEALSTSDQVAVMREGRIVQLGTPSQVYFHPSSRYVADFVGLANFVEVTVPEPGTVQLGGLRFALPTATATGPATLMARPEALRILAPGSTSDLPVLAGRVERRAFLGSVARTWVRTAEAEWTVDEPATDGSPERQDVLLALNPQRLHLLPRV